MTIIYELLGMLFFWFFFAYGVFSIGELIFKLLNSKYETKQNEK